MDETIADAIMRDQRKANRAAFRRRPILCLDFDGVIHSYSSGWAGARTILDPAVPGAFQFIIAALPDFRVAILSSRSHQWGGRRAMKRWLRAEFIKASHDWPSLPEWHRDWIAAHNFTETWEHDIRAAADALVHAIEWPLFKPSATVTIDDRARTFDGTWPALAELKAFQPWNKRKAA